MEKGPDYVPDPLLGNFTPLSFPAPSNGFRQFCPAKS